MQTLYHLCLYQIIKLKLCTYMLPDIIKRDLNNMDVKITCKNIVNNPMNFNFGYFGFCLNKIYFHKRYFSAMFIKYEKIAKRDLIPLINNNFKIPQLLYYYVQQDPDFFNWFHKLKNILH